MNDKYNEFADIVKEFIKTFGFIKFHSCEYYIENGIFNMQINKYIHDIYYDSLTFRYNLNDNSIINNKGKIEYELTKKFHIFQRKHKIKKIQFQ